MPQRGEQNVEGTVFLCHASEDKEAVRGLYHRLRSRGVRPWLDEEDLIPGQDWQQEIADAVRRSKAVVVLQGYSEHTQTAHTKCRLRRSCFRWLRAPLKGYPASSTSDSREVRHNGRTTGVRGAVDKVEAADSSGFKTKPLVSTALRHLPETQAVENRRFGPDAMNRLGRRGS